jgi:hypothetical protein
MAEAGRWSTAAAVAAWRWQLDGGGSGRCHRCHAAAAHCRGCKEETLAGTAMAGAQTTLNNQLNAVVATAMDTATMTAMMMITMKRKVMMAAAAAAA